MKHRDQLYEPLYSSLYEDDIPVSYEKDRPSVNDKFIPELSGSDWVRIVLLSLGVLAFGWAVLVLLFVSPFS